MPKRRHGREGPGHLGSGMGESTSVHRIGIGPKATSTGSPEEISRLGVHPLALGTAGKGKQEDDQPGKGELSSASEVPIGSFHGSPNILGDKVKKSLINLADLA